MTTPCMPSNLHTGKYQLSLETESLGRHPSAISLEYLLIISMYILRLFSKILVINDDLPLKILSGSVIIKPNVKEIHGSTMVFSDGTFVEKIRHVCFPEHFQDHNLKLQLNAHFSSSSQVDVLVFATDYNYDFPYLPSNAMYKSGHRVGLYKHVFPPNLEHPTLAVVGFIHALGVIMPKPKYRPAASPVSSKVRLFNFCKWSDFSPVTSWYLTPFSFFCFLGLKKLPSNQAMIKAVERDTKDMDNQ